jgi:hypothetical protein
MSTRGRERLKLGLLGRAQPVREADNLTAMCKLIFWKMEYIQHPRPIMGIDLLFYMQRMFVPHGKHACRPPRPVTEIAALLTFYHPKIFFFSFRTVVLRLCGVLTTITYSYTSKDKVV